MNMKTVLTVALSLGASAAFAEPDKVVSVTRVGTNPSTAGPSSNFTGAVRGRFPFLRNRARHRRRRDGHL